MPDWNVRPERPVKQVLRWKTDVLKSHDGLEHRQSLTAKPRNLLEYRYLLTDADTRRLEALLFNNSADVWNIPLWREGFDTDAVSLGAGSVSGDFTYLDLEDGGLALLVSHDGGTSEQVTVATSTTSTLTLSGVTANAYPGGAQAFPVISAYLRGHSLAPHQTALTTARLTFDATSALTAGGSGALNYANYQFKPSLTMSPPLETSRRFDAGVRATDSGLNHYQDARYQWADIHQARRYLISSVAERQQWEWFLDKVRGGWKSFRTPTYRPDLVLAVQPAVAHATYIEVEKDPNFETQWYTHPGHVDLHLFAPAAPRGYSRRITSINDTGSTLQLTLDGGAGSFATSINMVSFMELCVLSDEVHFEHYDGHSIVSVVMRVVQQ